MSLPYPIAFNGSTFRTVNIEKRLPTIETMIKAMPNITNVIMLKETGTADGKQAPVINVNTRPNTVPINEIINVCASTTLAK